MDDAIVMYIVINKPDTEFDLFLVLIYSHTAVDVIFLSKTANEHFFASHYIKKKQVQ